MSGELATQTPPCPTAIPEGMFSPSANTVNLSALPSPSVSSSTLTRSRPGPGLRRGYSRLSVIQMRPRSSKVIATGLTMSGSAATSSTRKPWGTVIARIASAGDLGALGARSWPCGIGAGDSDRSWAKAGVPAANLAIPPRMARTTVASCLARFIAAPVGAGRSRMSFRRLSCGRPACQDDAFGAESPPADGSGPGPGEWSGNSSRSRCKALGSTGLTM